MKPIKVEQVVWVEELGDNHAQKAKEILNELVFRQIPADYRSAVVCREVKLQYEHEREQLFDTRLGKIVYTGSVKLFGTYY
jgi:hypothetical protein